MKKKKHCPLLAVLSTAESYGQVMKPDHATRLRAATGPQPSVLLQATGLGLLADP
ncbi:MAG: hypothetical protein ACK4IT_05210 [Thioalkalivibrionaceae bacterium]